MASPPVPAQLRATAVPGILWPALTRGPLAGRLADLAAQLEDSQWWPAERLRARQYRQLAALLVHCARHVPFYRERLAEADYRPGKPLSPETWQRLPILTRAEAQAAGAALAAERMPPGHGGTSVVRTSGSTGMPVVITKTAVASLFWNGFVLRDHRWHGHDLSRRLAAIRAMEDGVGQYPGGLRTRSWSRTTALVQPTGPAFGLAITATTAQQLDWLHRVRPDYLLSYPSALAGLADFAGRTGAALPPLLGLQSFGETCTDDARATCRAAWGLRIADCYTTQEVGYIALECPDHEGSYHIQSEGVLVEVLDDAGQPCAPGQTGRLVATPLHNFAMPLIRYEVGDLAEVGAPCACGRGLPVLSRVGGRVRHVLRLAGGDTLWPRMRAGTYREVAPIRQFQLAQLALDRLEVRLVVERPLTADEEDQLRQRIRQRLGGRAFQIGFSYRDEIPRSSGGKYEDVRCEIPEVRG